MGHGRAGHWDELIPIFLNGNTIRRIGGGDSRGSSRRPRYIGEEFFGLSSVLVSINLQENEGASGSGCRGSFCASTWGEHPY